MALINYYGIQESLQSVLQTGPSGGYSQNPKNVYIEAMEREAVFDAMPFINVRLTEGEIEIRSLPNGYYATLTYEVDIITFNMAEFRSAALERDTMMGEAQLAVQQNSRFHAGISTSTISPTVRFGAGTPEGAGGHLAIGTFTVSVETYIDAA